MNFNPGYAQKLLDGYDDDVVAAGLFLAVDLMEEDYVNPDRDIVFMCVHGICKELKLKTPNPDDVNVRLKRLLERLAP